MTSISRAHLRPAITYILIFIIAASIGIYYRLYPLRTYTPQDASEKATLFVLAQLRQSVIQGVSARYPDLSSTEKDILINHEFNQLLHKERENVRQTITKAAHSIEEAALEKRPYPYLLASDSYYFYGLTKKILDTGSIGDKFRGSKFFYPKMLAPSGYWQPINLHPYIGAGVYQLMRIFNPDIDLMYAVSFTPLIITLLTIITLMITLTTLNCRPFFSLIGLVFFLLAPIYLKRSMFAWYDNDTYTTLFAFGILAIVFHAFQQLSTHTDKNSLLLKQPLILGVSAAFLSLVYAFFWEGWIFLLGVIFISAIFIGALYLILKRPAKELQNHMVFLTSYLISTSLFITTAFGISDFAVMFVERAGALKTFLAPQLSLWPDLFFTVGELQKTSLNELIPLAGGTFFCLISIVGLLSSLTKGLRNSPQKPLATTIVLTLLSVIAFYLSVSAQRFTLILLIPLAILFPIGLQTTHDILSNTIAKLLGFKDSSRKILSFLIALLAALTVLIPITHTHKTIETLPNNIYNDIWDDVLTQIQEKTPKNSVINTWWPPGHFIKAMANRRVTFDGATIGVPQAYWMAQFFLASDEQTAVGILRMLNNSGNDAVDFLTGPAGLPLSAGVEILKIAVRLNPMQAALFYMTFLKNNGDVEKLISLTHAYPPPTYCLLYNEFVEGNIQLGILGRWNFKKVEELNADPHRLKAVPPPKSKEHLDFIWDLVGGQLRYSGPMTELSRKGNDVIFPDNIVYDLKEKILMVNSLKYGNGQPLSVFYLENNNVAEKKQPQANLSYSAVIVQKENKYICLLMDTELARSMLVRLYFFDAKGLQFIKPTISSTDLTNRTEIKVFEIDWAKLYEQSMSNLPQ